jgi:hypothetical protein
MLLVCYQYVQAIGLSMAQQACIRLTGMAFFSWCSILFIVQAEVGATGSR